MEEAQCVTELNLVDAGNPLPRDLDPALLWYAGSAEIDGRLGDKSEV